MSNGFKVQFNLNKCIVKSCDGEAIVVAPHEQNLYIINFVKVHEKEAANLVQSLMGDGVVDLWYCRLVHLNVNSVHTIQNILGVHEPWQIFLPHILVVL